MASFDANIVAERGFNATFKVFFIPYICENSIEAHKWSFLKNSLMFNIPGQIYHRSGTCDSQINSCWWNKCLFEGFKLTRKFVVNLRYVKYLKLTMNMRVALQKDISTRVFECIIRHWECWRSFLFYQIFVHSQRQNIGVDYNSQAWLSQQTILAAINKYVDDFNRKIKKYMWWFEVHRVS